MKQSRQKPQPREKTQPRQKPQQRQNPQQRRVALMVESSWSSGRQILQGIVEFSRQVGYWSIFYEPSHFYPSLPVWFENWQGDGVIGRIRNPIMAEKLIQRGLPVVDVLDNVNSTGFPVVKCDDWAIGKLAAHHLMEHGIREFAYCGMQGPLWSTMRSDAFKQTITRAGYLVHMHQLPRAGGKAWFSERTQTRLIQWIADLPKPIGIMAAYDWVAQKVLDACRHLQVMVPEEVAVIGVDNDTTVCETCEPMLSSIVTRHDRVGFHAAELLDQLMQGKPKPSVPLIVEHPSIVTRQSTNTQTISDPDIADAVRFIRDHAFGEISVSDVAAHVALSYSKLTRRFRRVLLRSVHDEITRVRLDRVRELLAETRMTLVQIAEATGFRHQEYLGSVFKSKTGMTLKQFRDENGRKPE